MLKMKNTLCSSACIIEIVIIVGDLVSRESRTWNLTNEHSEWRLYKWVNQEEKLFVIKGPATSNTMP